MESTVLLSASETVHYWACILSAFCLSLFLFTIAALSVLIWPWAVFCAAGLRMSKGLVCPAAIPTGPVWSCIATPPWILPVCLYTALAADLLPPQTCSLYLGGGDNNSANSSMVLV
ncbi:hypothetical protein RRG08_052909 [Elysia crispata]|uniref:Uncharacterized protein n=1 Tax=Elysia crispata TaxID=231223 RepID=A0AAE0ZF41_9GAST|nr:hypothetical protein RRG08_052909 [Elysia crispata]